MAPAAVADGLLTNPRVHAALDGARLYINASERRGLELAGTRGPAAHACRQGRPAPARVATGVHRVEPPGGRAGAGGSAGRVSHLPGCLGGAQSNCALAGWCMQPAARCPLQKRCARTPTFSGCCAAAAPPPPSRCGPHYLDIAKVALALCSSVAKVRRAPEAVLNVMRLPKCG